MYKKGLIVAVLLLLPILVIANHSFGAKSDQSLGAMNQANHEMKYSSAQFTQPEPDEQEEINQEESSLEGFVKAAENDEMILYVHEKSLAIKLHNKKTGYIWGSGLDQPENYRLNKTWVQLVQSAVTVEYTDRQGKLRTESILTNDSRPNRKINR